MVEKTIELFKIQLQKKQLHLLIENLIPGEFQKITNDERRCAQIIINLLSNALKFTQPEGTIKIQLRIKEGNEKLRMISVSDTGIGIKQEDQSKLFEKFTKINLGDKLNMNSSGAGLGQNTINFEIFRLTISNELSKLVGSVEQDSYIQVMSEYGRGSTFSYELRDFNQYYNEEQNFQLPIISIVPEDIQLTQKVTISPMINTFQKSNQKQLSWEKKKEQNLKPSKNVLIVDDDQFNHEILKLIVHQSGKFNYNIFHSYNGQQCLELLKASKESFDIIFMDFNMPHLNGLQTTKQIRHNFETIGQKQPLIIGQTAYDSDDIKQKCLACGMNLVLIKPIKKSELQSILNDQI